MFKMILEFSAAVIVSTAVYMLCYSIITITGYNLRETVIRQEWQDSLTDLVKKLKEAEIEEDVEIEIPHLSKVVLRKKK